MRSYYVGGSPPVTAGGVFMLVVLVMLLWKWLLAGLAIGATVFLVVLGWRWWRGMVDYERPEPWVPEVTPPLNSCAEHAAVIYGEHRQRADDVEAT